jgi:cell division protein ZapB
MKVKDVTQNIELELQQLEARIEVLIRAYAHLREENAQLSKRMAAYEEERTQLIDKNEAARMKVEDMIKRLKSMEQLS